MQPTHNPVREAADLTTPPAAASPRKVAICESCGAPNPFGTPCQATRRLDGRPESDTDRRVFDLRQAGYLGPVDAEGHPAAPHGPVTVGSTLRAAARYLSKHGWCQGSYYDQTAGSWTPAACMVGAIGVVCYGGPLDAPAQQFDHPGFADFEAAVAWLDRYLTVRYGRVDGVNPYTAYEFNDAKGRTATEVIAELLHAARMWQAIHTVSSRHNGHPADEDDEDEDDWSPSNGMGMTQADLDAIDAEVATGRGGAA